MHNRFSKINNSDPQDIQQVRFAGVHADIGGGYPDTPPDPQEIALLRDVERNLAAVVGGTDTDPKVEVILHYLREQNWLERNGAIIFSQYEQPRNGR